MVKFCDECGKAILPSQINKKTQKIQCVCGNWIPVSAQEYFESKNQPTQVFKKDIKEIINQKLPRHCPNCSNELVLIDRNQEFLIQCSSFPDCDYLAKIPNPNELICPNCERKLAFFNLQRKLVLGCSGYPICKFIIQTYLSDKTPSKPSSTTKSLNKFHNKVIKIPEKCPKCESTFQLRQGPYGTFLGCRRYPSCKYSFNVEDPDKIYCPICENIMVKRTGKYGAFLGCTNYPDCRYTINMQHSSQKKEKIEIIQDEIEIKTVSTDVRSKDFLLENNISNFVYILKLENDKWWVGRSRNPKERIYQHKYGKGSKWTKENKVISVDKVIENGNLTEITLSYMKKYGWEKIRGTCFNDFYEGYIPGKIKKYVKDQKNGKEFFNKPV